MTKKVLIVDDDQEFLRILQKDLEKYSRTFSLLTAENGVVATEMLKQHKISLVVTDLEMPRTGDQTLLTHLKEHYPDIHAIILSSSSTPEKEQYASRQGVAVFLNKPCIIEDLAKNIVAALKKEADGGVLHGIAPGTFLQLLEMEQKTCTIRLVDDKSSNQGVLFFKEGELYNARIDELRGKEAAYKILSWDEATLSIQESCSLKENTIQADLQAVLLEAMRLKDEGEIEQQSQTSSEETNGYIVLEGEDEEEPEIIVEVEEPEIIVEEDEKIVVLEEEKPGPDILSEPEKEPGRTAGFEHIPQAPSTEEAAVSFSMADNIFGTLADIKQLIFGSAVVKYAFRIIIFFVIVCLIGFTYLFITLESESDLARQIDQAKTHINLKQKALYKTDAEIQRLYTLKEDSIKNNESQVVIMDLDLKISELEEKQEKILTETKIQQKAMEECQAKLEAIKREPFFDRLLKRIEPHLSRKK
jgi:CheY-like chemotaxis protein